MPNARVLPEPVRPRPRMSAPAKASGRTAAWMGKGASMPAAVSTAASGAGTPSDVKVAPCAMFAGLVRAAAPGAGQEYVQWAELS